MILNDPKLLRTNNLARNRRLAFVASYAAGCLIGGAIHFTAAGALFFALLLKLAIGASFLLNRGKVVMTDVEGIELGEENHELVSPAKTLWAD